MARVFGLLLMILGIYCGLKIYLGELDRASRDVAVEEAAAAMEPESESVPGRGAPSAVTSRVRERVTDAVAEGARRHSGEAE
ncbi:MAG TPA: hypothetical protein VFT98_15750 [Myxococcota bacterium]|nr:hypothetical protein [Myxococcota bacterium]